MIIEMDHKGAADMPRPAYSNMLVAHGVASIMGQAIRLMLKISFVTAVK